MNSSWFVGFLKFLNCKKLQKLNDQTLFSPLFFICRFFLQALKTTYLIYIFKHWKPWRQLEKAWEAKSTCTKAIPRSRFCSIVVLYLNCEAFLQIGFIGKVLSHFHYCIDSTQEYHYNIWGSKTVTMFNLYLRSMELSSHLCASVQVIHAYAHILGNFIPHLFSDKRLAVPEASITKSCNSVDSLAS